MGANFRTGEAGVRDFIDLFFFFLTILYSHLSRRHKILVQIESTVVLYLEEAASVVNVLDVCL